MFVSSQIFFKLAKSCKFRNEWYKISLLLVKRMVISLDIKFLNLGWEMCSILKKAVWLARLLLCRILFLLVGICQSVGTIALDWKGFLGKLRKYNITCIFYSNRRIFEMLTILKFLKESFRTMIFSTAPNEDRSCSTGGPRWWVKFHSENENSKSLDPPLKYQWYTRLEVTYFYCVSGPAKFLLEWVPSQIWKRACI